MSSSDRKFRAIIPAEEAGSFSRWSMPEMTAEERKKLVALARRSKPEILAETSDPIEVVEEPLYAEKMTLAEWEKIRDEAYQEGFDEGKRQGLEVGRQEGVALGLEQGLQNAQAQIDARLEQVQQLVESLKQPLAEQEESLHQLIMQLVFKLAKAMVAAEFASNPEHLRTAVSEALLMIPPTSGAPVLSLHPYDCALLENLADREGWELKENPDSSPGDIRLVVGSCVIDLDLEQRFDQVAGALKQKILGIDDGSS